MKKCNCSHLEIIRDSNGQIDRLQCINCKKTWKWNPFLCYWSDSYLGSFVKKSEEEKAK